jgi:hypothetical protein
MFMCVVNLKSVNKLDLTWKRSFLILNLRVQNREQIANIRVEGGAYCSTAVNYGRKSFMKTFQRRPNL